MPSSHPASCVYMYVLTIELYSSCESFEDSGEGEHENSLVTLPQPLDVGPLNG